VKDSGIVEHFQQRPPQAAYPGRDGRGSGLRRFIGGSPAAVFLRLLFLSVLVGAVLAMLGLTPERLFWHAYETIRALFDLGFETLHDFGRWILAGAVIVVPIWLISRLFAAR